MNPVIAGSSTAVKTRFAPSPTGDMHVGNARTALFAALFARQQKGVFLLRVEDTDAARSRSAYCKSLLADLQTMGLHWQEGPYYQSERAPIYSDHLQRLAEKNLAYRCFCSPETLAVSRKYQLAQGQPPRYAGGCYRLTPEEVGQRLDAQLPFTWRFRVPAAIDAPHLDWVDLIKGPQRSMLQAIGDFVLTRQDGSAAFFFANALDDALMGVTHVIRGEDHLTNTPRQILLMRALDLPVPLYAHLPMIVGADNQKLSKRNGSVALSALLSAGFLPEAITNYLARIGHQYPAQLANACLSFDELANALSWEGMGHAAARYDTLQLHFWQKQALRQLSVQQLADWVLPSAVQSEHADWLSHTETAVWQQAVQRLAHNWVLPEDGQTWLRICYADPLWLRSLSEPDSPYQTIWATLTPQWCQQASETLLRAFAAHATPEARYDAWIGYLREATGSKGPALFKPLRLLLTGGLQGPELKDLCAVIPLERLRQRFEQAAQYLA